MPSSHKEARQLVKSIARGIRVCENNDQLRFHWAGRWFDIEKERAEAAMNKGVELIVKTLGKSKAVQEFQHYGVSIQEQWITINP